MMDTALLDQTCSLLEQRYGALGAEAAGRLRRWISGEVPYAYPEILARHLGTEHIDLLFDAFWQELPFGTGGRRGRVGYGANRMNPSTVAMTVQGHCNRLLAARKEDEALRVVVANDVRVFKDSRATYSFLGGDHPLLGVSARSLARLAAQVYAANGIAAYLKEPDHDDAVMATPMLSYLIWELKAAGGINLSASHNPPDDNGVKVYDAFGSQPVAPEDQHLIDAMKSATDIKLMDYDEARAAGLILPVPPETLETYLRTYTERYGQLYTHQDGDPPVVYTPLCGCGLTTAGELLRRCGVQFVTPPDQGPDGTFQAIPLKAPNPEVTQSTVPAMQFADAHGASLVLSSDPDADRVGVEAKVDGEWVHMDGDQIAAILAYYLMLDPLGPRLKGLIIETLVTTKILGRIVANRGESWIVDDLLVGFKYISDVLRQLDDNGHYKDVVCNSSDLVMSTEESHGIQVIPWIRDKDSAPACLFLAALHLRLLREGSNLLAYYVHILEEVGGFDTAPRSIMLSGADGMLKKNAIMASLRSDPFTTIGGQKVNRVVDHWDPALFGPFVSDTEQLPRDVMQFFLDEWVVTVRPSGTEPKLKLYSQFLPQGLPEQGKGRALLDVLRAHTEAFSRTFYNALLQRVDLSLGEAALRLPDIIDHHQKVAFEDEHLPALRQAVQHHQFQDVDALLGWFRERIRPLVPGADPLPAVKDALIYRMQQWDELRDEPLYTALRAWAGA